MKKIIYTSIIITFCSIQVFASEPFALKLDIILKFENKKEKELIKNYLKIRIDDCKEKKIIDNFPMQKQLNTLTISLTENDCDRIICGHIIDFELIYKGKIINHEEINIVCKNNSDPPVIYIESAKIRKIDNRPLKLHVKIQNPSPILESYRFEVIVQNELNINLNNLKTHFQGEVLCNEINNLNCGDILSIKYLIHNFDTTIKYQFKCNLDTILKLIIPYELIEKSNFLFVKENEQKLITEAKNFFLNELLNNLSLPIDISKAVGDTHKYSNFSNRNNLINKLFFEVYMEFLYKTKNIMSFCFIEHKNEIKTYPLSKLNIQDYFLLGIKDANLIKEMSLRKIEHPPEPGKILTFVNKLYKSENIEYYIKTRFISRNWLIIRLEKFNNKDKLNLEHEKTFVMEF